MEQFKHALKQAGKKVRKTLFGPGVLDQNFPDQRPINPAREKFQEAKIMAGIETKDQALARIRDSKAAGWYEYDYEKPLHEKLVSLASQRARELGASDDEIGDAIREGNVQGATMRSGFED